MTAHKAPRGVQVVVVVGLFVFAAVAVVYFVGVAPSRESDLQHARRAALLGRTEAAVTAFEKHLRNHPNDFVARLELAAILKPIDADRSLAHLRMIPKHASQYADAVWNSAHIATSGGMDELAEELLTELDSIRPGDPGVSLTLAELYYRTERFAEALRWAQATIERKPDRAKSWLLVAEIFDRLRRTGEMREPLEEAISLDPDLYEAHANLAYVLHFSGELDSAEREARWCLDRKPDDVAVNHWLALILRDRGDHPAALAQVRRALKFAPENVESRLVEADLLLYQRKADEAYELLLPLYEKHADRRDLLGSLARAAAMSGRRKEAERYQLEVRRLIKQGTRDAGFVDPDSDS